MYNLFRKKSTVESGHHFVVQKKYYPRDYFIIAFTPVPIIIILLL